MKLLYAFGAFRRLIKACCWPCKSRDEIRILQKMSRAYMLCVHLYNIFCNYQGCAQPLTEGLKNSGRMKKSQDAYRVHKSICRAWQAGDFGRAARLPLHRVFGGSSRQLIMLRLSVRFSLMCPAQAPQRAQQAAPSCARRFACALSKPHKQPNKLPRSVHSSGMP